MFVEIKENNFINLQQVREVMLREDPIKWVFVIGVNDAFGKVVTESQDFKTKEEALKWFEENIKPALNDYNHAQFNI